MREFTTLEYNYGEMISLIANSEHARSTDPVSAAALRMVWGDDGLVNHHLATEFLDLLGYGRFFVVRGYDHGQFSWSLENDFRVKQLKK